MDSKPIAVLIAFLAIFAILLPGCVSPSASPGTTGPVTPDNPGLLSASVYPGIHPEERSGPAYDYDPIVQEFVMVGKNSDETRVFSITVNLSSHTDQDGNRLNPGDYVAEIHAVNMNSTVSDNQVISLSEEDLLIHMIPLKDP